MTIRSAIRAGKARAKYTKRRVHSDAELRRKRYAPDLAASFRKALKEWRAATDKAMGHEVMSATDRRAVREEVQWGVRWLRDVERSIELRLPEAAVACTVELCNLLATLSQYMDQIPQHNRLVPLATRGEANRRVNQEGGKNATLVKQQQAKARDDAIRLEFKRLKKRYAGNNVGQKFLYSQIQDTVFTSKMIAARRSGKNTRPISVRTIRNAINANPKSAAKC